MNAASYLRASVALGVVAVAVSAYLSFDLYRSQHSRLEDAKTEAREEASRGASEVDARLRRIASVARSLSDDLAAGRVTSKTLDERLTEILMANSVLFAAGVAYAPVALDSPRRLSAPYQFRVEGSIEKGRLEDEYDYTGPETEWYTNAVENGKAWAEPTWQEVAQGLTTTYAVTFRLSDAGERPGPSGVAFLSVSVDRVTEATGALNVGKTGWSLVASKQGRLISHPLAQVVRDGASIRQIAQEYTDPLVLEEANKALRGEAGVFEAANGMTGQTSWFAYEPIPETGWTGAVVRIKDEVEMDEQSYRRGLIWISVTAIVGLSCLGALFCLGWNARRPSNTSLWILVVFLSLLLLGGMALIRHVTYNQRSEQQQASVKILDPSGLRTFLQSQEQPSEGSVRQTIHVPSGVFIQSMKFSAPNELLVTGVLWQKFNKESEGISEGFVLPDAVQSTLTEAYRRKEGPGETVGWFLRATVRQQLNLSRYPFDHDNVSIKLLHKDFDRGVMLVPDLGSYTLINPTARPGLKQNLALPGWDVAASFFDYKFSDYRTDFGLSGYQSRESIPELHFNVSLKRNLLDAAISNGIPLLVVLLMLFAIVVTSTKTEKESKLVGFNPSAVMRVTSALFFVVLLAHIQLRNTLQTQEVVFMEYLYFTVYLAILFTSAHSFFFLMDRFKIRFIEYESSLVSKLLFWPVLLGLQFLITIVLFY